VPGVSRALNAPLGVYHTEELPILNRCNLVELATMMAEPGRWFAGGKTKLTRHFIFKFVVR
jgi:hypothetical protein